MSCDGRRQGNASQGSLMIQSIGTVKSVEPDNTPAGLRSLLSENRRWRTKSWPAPFDVTRHRLKLGDARDLSWIADESIHLVVTSPPYWVLKDYEHSEGQ